MLRWKENVIAPFSTPKHENNIIFFSLEAKGLQYFEVFSKLKYETRLFSFGSVPEKRSWKRKQVAYKHLSMSEEIKKQTSSVDSAREAA